MIKVREATKEDFLKFYDQIEYTCKGWVIENKDILAIGGLAFHKYGIVLFSVAKQNIPKKIFWSLSKKGLEEAKKYNMPILAVRDSYLESSERYLKKLGFVFYNFNTNKEEIWVKQQD
jgi:hypothetical protein